jgi:poly [ADP-ribose] polymerase
MFGKGIYFADMVSKSANYCYTNAQNPVGLIMLCEVALGKMQEHRQAFNVTKLPAKHQCFLFPGVGITAPDPQGSVTLINGTVVPMGRGMPTGIAATSLQYNE